MFVFLNIEMKGIDGNELGEYKAALKQLIQNKVIEQTKLGREKNRRALALK